MICVSFLLFFADYELAVALVGDQAVEGIEFFEFVRQVENPLEGELEVELRLLAGGIAHVAAAHAVVVNRKVDVPGHLLDGVAFGKFQCAADAVVDPSGNSTGSAWDWALSLLVEMNGTTVGFPQVEVVDVRERDIGLVGAFGFENLDAGPVVARDGDVAADLVIEVALLVEVDGFGFGILVVTCHAQFVGGYLSEPVIGGLSVQRHTHERRKNVRRDNLGIVGYVWLR